MYNVIKVNMNHTSKESKIEIVSIFRITYFPAWIDTLVLAVR